MSSWPLTNTWMTGVLEAEVPDVWTTSMILVWCPTWGRGVTISTGPTTRTAPVFTGGLGLTVIVTAAGLLFVVAGVACGPEELTRYWNVSVPANPGFGV